MGVTLRWSRHRRRSPSPLPDAPAPTALPAAPVLRSVREASGELPMLRVSRPLFRLWLACVLLIAVATGLRADSATVGVIERLHQALIETMQQADRLDIDARYAKLEPVLTQTFDFERMIAAAAGSYWTGASDAEKDRLQQAFTHLSVMTYAARFSGFSGERFETLGERPGPRGSVLVDTQLVRPDAPAVAITYVMADSDGTPRIVDVLLDRSISELAVRRSEYNQVLRNGGVEKLASTLDEKAEALRKGTSGVAATP
jgi:phospholipid transport system substrate-binding protein